jgi:hypothetical protein
MQYAPILPKRSVGQPFDRATAIAWGAACRHEGVLLRIATDHEKFPEVIEISPPGTNEPWWCIWQDPAGRLVVDNWHTWERSRVFADMTDALDFVTGEIGTVKQSQIQPDSRQVGRLIAESWHTLERNRLRAGMADTLDHLAGQIRTASLSDLRPVLRRASGPS